MKQPTEKGAQTSMDQFMLEIKKMLKNLKDDENNNEQKETRRGVPVDNRPSTK